MRLVRSSTRNWSAPLAAEFLNHSGGDITDHYIRDRALGQLQLAEQETISAHIIKALGSPRGLV